MATITSTKSGLASDPTVWSGGVVPVEGDKVIIAAGHVVTLDGDYTWGDDNNTATIGTAAVSVSGTLKASRTVNSSLTVKGLLYTDYATHALDFGTDADPIPDGITAALILNKAGTPAQRDGWRQRTDAAAGSYIKNTFVGSDVRARSVLLLSDTSTASAVIRLSSATHGWKVGDEVMLFTTTDNTTTDEVEVRTVAGIDVGDSRLVTLSAAPTYVHKAGSPVGNRTCNVTLTSYNKVNGQMANPATPHPNGGAATLGYTYTFKNTRIEAFGSGSVASGFSAGGGSIVSSSNAYWIIYKCVIVNRVTSGGSLFNNTTNRKITIEDSVLDMSGGVSYQAFLIDLKKCVMAVSYVWNSGSAGGQMTDCWLTSRSTSTPFDAQSGMRLVRTTISGCCTSILGGSSGAFGMEFLDCDIGYTYGIRTYYGDNLFRLSGQVESRAVVDMTNCKFGSQVAIPASASNLAPQSDRMNVAYINKNGDAAQQEIYRAAGVLKRNNATKNRGASSIALTHNKLGADIQRTQSIPCANGQTIRVVGYVRMDTAYYNGGDCNLPTVSLSGLGATPVTFTATSAANNAWQQYDISITNTAGYDGNFTLTFTANAKTVSTGTVYFDGVPDAPFITKARHYGFVFNETSPTVQVNPYTVASEATAAAYTGTTINTTTKRVSFGAGTIDTLAKLYDYSQAWGCLNIDKDMPWTRAGALLSLATGWTVVSPTIPGVTWGGGNVEFGTPGTVNQSFDSSDITFTAAGTYDMGGSVFAGTVEFINTSGGAVTVKVPAGTSYTNTGPNITVDVAVDSAHAVVSNIVAGSRLQIYNVTTATEMVNTIVVGTSYSADYFDGTGYTAGDVVRVRLAWYSGATAKLPVEYRTVATEAGWTILADQQDDAIYNANAIDGDDCTEFSHDFLNVQVDVGDADGSTTPQRGYAWFIAGQSTADGIRYFFGGIQALDAANYRINAGTVNLKVQNTLVDSHLMVRGARLFRSDGASIFATHASGASASHDYGAAIPLETGVSGLTTEESSKLLALDTSNLDVAVSTRLAAASYTAPDNAGIAAVESAVAALDVPTVPEIVAGVEASTVLAKEQTAALAAALSA